MATTSSGGGWGEEVASIQTLLELVLRRTGGEAYAARKRKYPTIDGLGLLPSHIGQIISDDNVWGCHGLAFRLATYGPGNEEIFSRLEQLLSAPEGAEGWQDELSKWTNKPDHWAINWDRFYQFLWLLQCFEYAAESNERVTFPVGAGAAAPDMKAENTGRFPHFIECYYFTKWWAREHFLADLLGLLNPNLAIRRPRNIIYPEASNPFSRAHFPNTLSTVLGVLDERSLLKWRELTATASPQVLLTIGTPAIEIILTGPGVRIANADNAHGSGSDSAQNFFLEIVRAKAGKNGLTRHRPNILLVNGLGDDFQTQFFDEDVQLNLESEELDEVHIASCGINEALSRCRMRRVITRGLTHSP